MRTATHTCFHGDHSYIVVPVDETSEGEVQRGGGDRGERGRGKGEVGRSLESLCVVHNIISLITWGFPDISEIRLPFATL